MNYNIKKIQADSKQRYIDLDIYVEGCDISGIDVEQTQAAIGYVNAQVAAGKLPHVTTLKCCDCGLQANHYHHNVSYKMEHWLCVVPLCQSCHFSLHNKIDKNTFYNFGIVQSVTNYLVTDTDITLYILIALHGTSKNSIADICSKNNLQTKFRKQYNIKQRGGVIKPNKKKLSNLYTQLQSTRKVAKELGVSQPTVSNWLKEYSILTNENSIDRNVRLKPNEDELLNYIMQGYNQKQIATTIGVAESTISKWITELPDDKLIQTLGVDKYNKNIHKQIKATKRKLKRQRCSKVYRTNAIVELEEKLQ